MRADCWAVERPAIGKRVAGSRRHQQRRRDRAPTTQGVASGIHVYPDKSSTTRTRNFLGMTGCFRAEDDEFTRVGERNDSADYLTSPRSYLTEDVAAPPPTVPEYEQSH